MDAVTNKVVFTGNAGKAFGAYEPTMDGTASLIYLLAAKEREADGKIQKARTRPK